MKNQTLQMNLRLTKDLKEKIENYRISFNSKNNLTLDFTNFIRFLIMNSLDKLDKE